MCTSLRMCTFFPRKSDNTSGFNIKGYKTRPIGNFPYFWKYLIFLILGGGTLQERLPNVIISRYVILGGGTLQERLPNVIISRYVTEGALSTLNTLQWQIQLGTTSYCASLSRWRSNHHHQFRTPLSKSRFLCNIFYPPKGIINRAGSSPYPSSIENRQ